MIDARAATGVPCITTCPLIIPAHLLVPDEQELADWQIELLAAQGFLVYFTSRGETPHQRPPTTR